MTKTFLALSRSLPQEPSTALLQVLSANIHRLSMVKSPLRHSICSPGVKINCLKLFSLSQTLQQQKTHCTRACSLRFILTGRH